MTVATSTNRVDYTGNGSTTVFPFSFRIFAATDLVVTRADTSGAETTLVLNTDYTVSGAGSYNGGNVTLGSALTSGYTLTIQRVLEITQETDLRNQGAFFAETHEDVFDRMIMISQQLQEQIDRSAKLPITAVAEDIEQFTQDILVLVESEDDLNTIASNITKITTVADDLNEAVSEINTVATSITNVDAVGSNISNVNSVASNATNINTVAGQISPTNRISTVAGISGNITTVAGISSNVTSVAGNSSNINTVAGNNTNVTNVGSNISNVNLVAGQISPTNNISTVAGKASQIQTVATNISDVNTVAGVSSNVTTVAGISSAVSSVSSNASNINTVAGQISPTNNISTVAGISSNVTTVAGISSAVSSVSSNATNINAVAGISSDVTAVAAIAGDISAAAAIDAADLASVADVASDVTTVAGVSGNVTTVAGISANVTTVAGISSNVGTVAGIAANVSTVAGISANVTTVAGISADVSTVADNVADITNFSDVYQGAKSSDPSTRNDSSALQAGDLYFSTSGTKMRVYTGTAWADTGTASPVTITIDQFSGTGSQTVFTMSTPAGFSNAVAVEVSGVGQRVGTDFTVSGTTLTFASAPPSGTNNIYVTIISSYAGGVPNDGSVTTAKLASGFTLPVASGGTNATTAAGARASLLPSFTGNGGKVLAVNAGATDVEYITTGAGTVTSVSLSAPTGLTVGGSPVTSSGTLALTFTSGYSIPTDSKQTNWDTAYGWGNHASAGYLTSSAIGSSVQAYDADLDTWATKTAPSGTVVGTSDTQTLTNKRVTQRVNDNGATTSGTITPNGDTTDQFDFKGLTGSVAIAAPSGTPTAGQRLVYRIKDNGTTRALDWTTAGVYRAIGVTLPTSTTAGKTTYVGLIYNLTDTKWDAVAVTTEA